MKKKISSGKRAVVAAAASVKVAASAVVPARAGKASAKGAADKAAAAQPAAKRKLGLRGAAPWAARHAAKHAAEARARAAVPPPPGSARATIRVPSGAEEIKAKIGELHNALVQIRGLRKNVGKGFYAIGEVLRDVQARKLYEAKGYGSFEAFLEREIDLGKTTALKLVRIVSVFVKDAAQEHGMDRVIAALTALETATESASKQQSGITMPSVTPSAPKIPLPIKPPLRSTG